MRKFNGIEFFPLVSNNSTEISLLEARFGLMGYAVYVKLMQKIFSNKGYYFKIDEDVIVLLTKEFSLNYNDTLVKDVIDECLKRDLFDKVMYKKFGILTSEEIQDDYLIAIKRRKNVCLEKKYLYQKGLDYLKKLEEEGENLNESEPQMYAEMQKMYTQSQKMYAETLDLHTDFNREEKKIEEIRLDKKIKDFAEQEREEENAANKVAVSLDDVSFENDTSLANVSFGNDTSLSTAQLNKTTNTNNKIINNDNSYSTFQNEGKRELRKDEINLFTSAFPCKAIDANIKVPANFNMDELIKVVNDSKFLKTLDNLNFNWLIKHYNKVINGKYNDFKKLMQNSGKNSSDDNSSNNIESLDILW